MANEQHAGDAEGDIEISAGSTATLDGGWRVGVKSIRPFRPDHVPGANPVLTARVVVSGYDAGVAAEYTLDVRQGDVLPTGTGRHRVLRVVSMIDASERASVELARQAAGGEASSGGLFLSTDGMLRLNGPATHGASDVTVVRWIPDDRTPTKAEVEWRPSQFTREDTNPADIRTATVGAGDSLTVGASVLHVASIERHATDHAVWLRFDLPRKLPPR